MSERLDGEKQMNQLYHPVTVAIPENDLWNILECLELGLESSQQLLTEHDLFYERTTKKNKIIAKTMESEIERIQAVIKQLKTRLS